MGVVLPTERKTLFFILTTFRRLKLHHEVQKKATQKIRTGCGNGRIDILGSSNMDCTMVAAAPVLPPGYVVSASRIADRRLILTGYRLANLLRRVVRKLRTSTLA
jgi:hypothetical protein